MNKYTIVLLAFNALFVLITVDGSTCPQVSEFPPWMVGHFFVQFDDGSLANKTVGLLYANMTLPNGTLGIQTMTAPLNRSDHFYIFHDCLHLQGAEPQQRCSIVVPNCNGYKQYMFKTPGLVSTCPNSTTLPGVETQTVERNG